MNKTRNDEPSTASRGLDELAAARPLLATQEMPQEMKDLLEPDSGVYVRSEHKPSMDFGFEAVPGTTDMWRVLDNASQGELRTEIRGLERRELEPPARMDMESTEGTDSYRPPWAVQEFLPRLVPFELSARDTGLRESRVVLEPRASEAERLPYPWRTVGRIIVRSSLGTWAASGVLVGPNLVLTASHIAPWDGANWSMEFIPALREGDANPRPWGSSFTEQFRGYRSAAATGYDYVLCKLYRPLGSAIGWMGTIASPDSEALSHSYFSSGYPANFGGRPAVQAAVGIRDIDADSPGREYETVTYTSGGWDGGPLWFYNGQPPMVRGVLSGSETDVFDPRRDVYAGFHAMVDLVKFGLENWRP
jgi:V8-like Glu-specific endopeptidase